MVDSLKDRSITRAIEEGRVYGDGAILSDPNTSGLRKSSLEAQSKNWKSPETIIEITPLMHVADFRSFTQNHILEAIYQKWGETPDTLIPSSREISKSDKIMTNGLLITQTFEATDTPPGIEKIEYKFRRRGEYGKEVYDKTEVVRLEYTVPPIDTTEDGSVLELVGGIGELPIEGQGDKGPIKGIGKNQYYDKNTGLLVTYHSTPINLISR